MRPLLWKEYRELRTTLLVWLAALVAVQALRQFRAVEELIRSGMVGLFLFTGVLSAVALGSELLTRERESRMLDYLLTRPVSAHQIVWAKFLAGSIALLVFVGALLALVFLTRPVSVVHSGGYLASLAAVYPRLWFILAFTLAVSVLTGARAKAAVATLLILGGSFGILSVVYQWQLWLDPEIWIMDGPGGDAHALVTGSPRLLAMIAGVWSVLAVAAAALAAALFARRPDRSLGWPLIVVGGAACFLVVPNVLQTVELPVAAVPSAGAYSLEGQTASLMAAEGKRVCVVAGGELLVIDFSDPAHPRPSAQVSLPPPWTFTNIQLHGSRVFLAGRRKEIPDDRAAVVSFDLTSPEKRVTASLGVAGAFDWIGRPEEVGGHIYAGVGSRWKSTLHVFAGSTETTSLTIEEPRDPAATSIGPLQFDICVRGNYAYVVSTGTLTTLHVSDPAHPRLVGRTELAPRAQLLYGARQQVALAGRRVYIPGYRPRRLLAFDLTDPARPARAEAYDWLLRYDARLGTLGGALTICLPLDHGALVFAPQRGPWPGRVSRVGGPDRPPHSHKPVQFAFGDYLYVLIDGERLAAYPVAGGV